MLGTKEKALPPFPGLSDGCTNGKQCKCSHTCVFGKQFECEHTQNFCAERRQKCLPKCLLGSLPKPGCLRPGADAPSLNFGTKCPKAEIPGNSKNCSPADRKMWKVFSNIRAGHIIILPLHKSRLETLANRAFFRAKCLHINPVFRGVPDSRKHSRPPTNKDTPHKAFLPVPSAGRVLLYAGSLSSCAHRDCW